MKAVEILKERKSGLFLIFFAGFIIFGTSLNSRAVEPEKQTSNNGEVLGEIDNDNPEVIDLEKSQDNRSDAALQEETGNDEKNEMAPQTDKYDEIKSYLKKYCKKSGSNNRKKCEKYCLEIKNKNQYRNLRKKYCGNEDKEDEGQNANQAVAAAKNELEFIINSDGKTSRFDIQFEEGETVYELMKKAKTDGKMTYEKNTDETYGVYINEINGLKEESDLDWTKNKYWILYVDGKISSVGCSKHKLTKSDNSIEWKYEKYSF